MTNAGRSAAWLARLPWEQEVGGSNPLAPTISSAVPLSFPALRSPESVTAWRVNLLDHFVVGLKSYFSPSLVAITINIVAALHLRRSRTLPDPRTS